MAGVEIDPVTGGPIVNENRETEREGIFACGNVLHVHDLADYVTEEGEIVGKAVSDYLFEKEKRRIQSVKILPGENIGYVVPQHIDCIISNGERIKLFMRVKKPQESVRINLSDEQGNILISFKKKIVTPGEMVNLFLPEILLQKQLKSLTVSVEKENKE